MIILWYNKIILLFVIILHMSKIHKISIYIIFSFLLLWFAGSISAKNTALLLSFSDSLPQMQSSKTNTKDNSDKFLNSKNEMENNARSDNAPVSDEVDSDMQDMQSNSDINNIDNQAEKESRDNSKINTEPDNNTSILRNPEPESENQDKSSISPNNKQNTENIPQDNIDNDVTAQKKPAVEILKPQNGSTVDDNFEVRVLARTHMNKLSLYQVEMINPESYNKSSQRRIINLEYSGDYWIGVVEIQNFKNGIYHFIVEGVSDDGNIYTSSVFWVNIQKIEEDEESMGNIEGIPKKTVVTDIREIEEEMEKKNNVILDKDNKERGEKNNIIENDRKNDEIVRKIEEIEKKEKEIKRKEYQENQDKKERAQEYPDDNQEVNRLENLEKDKQEISDIDMADRKDENNNQPEGNIVRDDNKIFQDFYFKISDLCIEAGFNDKDECLNFFEQPDICKGLNEEQCRNLIKETFLSDFIPKEEKQKIDQEIRNIAGYNLNINFTDEKDDIEIIIRDKDRVNDNKNKEIKNFVEKYIPIDVRREKEVNLIVLGTKSETDKTIPAVIAFDDDNDKIPNDTEIRLGTDPYSKDTDNDGYDDYTEIINGYNPLGSGKINQSILRSLSSVDLAIINHRNLEQPKEQGEITDVLKVEKIDNLEKENKNSIVLKGKGYPFSVVTIYIYSQLPLVMTTSVDANGNWVYTLDNNLADGSHQVYVTVNDNTGKVRFKSNPVFFFVKEAKAVTREEFLNTASKEIVDRPTRNFYYYIAGTVILILILIILYLMLIRKNAMQKIDRQD